MGRAAGTVRVDGVRTVAGCALEVGCAAGSQLAQRRGHVSIGVARHVRVDRIFRVRTRVGVRIGVDRHIGSVFRSRIAVRRIGRIRDVLRSRIALRHIGRIRNVGLRVLDDVVGRVVGRSVCGVRIGGSGVAVRGIEQRDVGRVEAGRVVAAPAGDNERENGGTDDDARSGHR